MKANSAGWKRKPSVCNGGERVCRDRQPRPSAIDDQPAGQGFTKGISNNTGQVIGIVGRPAPDQLEKRAFAEIAADDHPLAGVHHPVCCLTRNHRANRFTKLFQILRRRRLQILIAEPI